MGRPSFKQNLRKKLLESYSEKELDEMDALAEKWIKDDPKTHIMVVGAGGQIGSYANDMLMYMFGKETVTLLDYRQDEEKGIEYINGYAKEGEEGSLIDLLKTKKFADKSVHIYNFAAALSVDADRDKEASFKLNRDFPVRMLTNLVTKLMFELDNVIRIHTPSSIGAYRLKKGETLIKTGTPTSPGEDNAYGEQKQELQDKTAITNRVIKSISSLTDKFISYSKNAVKALVTSPVFPGIYTAKISPSNGTTEQIDDITSFFAAKYVSEKYGVDLEKVFEAGGNNFQETYINDFKGEKKYFPKIPIDAEVVMMTAESLTLNLFRLTFSDRDKVIENAHQYAFGDTTMSVRDVIEGAEGLGMDTSIVKSYKRRINKLMDRNMEFWPNEADTSKAEEDFDYKKRSITPKIAVYRKLKGTIADYEEKMLATGLIKEKDIKPDKLIEDQLWSLQAKENVAKNNFEPVL